MSKMKDSGIEWIGQIPEDWQLSKIGAVYDERNTKVSDKDYTPLSVTKQGVVPQLETAAKTDNGDNRKLIKKNDFVINSRSDRRGSCGISELDGSCSLINTVLKPRNNMCNKYYNYIFHSDLFSDEFYRWGNGIVDDLWSTKWSEMKRIYIPYPSLATQSRIADYLDEKCGEIDRYIEKQQQIIEKLKAFKQAVITEAVTKGLDPTVPMKDSGIEWIGMIPAHWKQFKVKQCATTCSGGTPNSNDTSLYDGGINWVCSFDLMEKEIFSTIKTLSEKGAELIAGELQQPNSILIAMYGGAGTIGNSGLLKCEARTNQAICSIHFNENIFSPEFAFYHTIFLRKYWMYYAVGTRKDPNISQEVIKQMVYACPPIDEQKIIALYLEKKCAEIDKTISKTQMTIDKLSDYKKSLVYEAVTGKIEV